MTDTTTPPAYGYTAAQPPDSFNHLPTRLRRGGRIGASVVAGALVVSPWALMSRLPTDVGCDVEFVLVSSAIARSSPSIR